MPGGIHAPIEEILRWPRPNYVNPTTRPNTILVLSSVFGPITFAMLMARLWVRVFHQRNPGWDDWLLVAGTIPTIALTAIFPLAARSGFDRHIWDLNVFRNPEGVVVSRKYVLAILCLFCVASGLIKISILLFYRRLSSRVVSNSFRWATWITIGFIATSTVAFTLAPILGCQPISAFWDQVNSAKILKGYKYRCFNEGADVFTASVISTFQDLITAILPTFLYWDLRIPVRQKVALFGIFAIGYGVAALGAMRAYYSWRTFFETYDVTWVTWDLFVVTLLELHVGCFCANAPTFKVFFKHFFHDKLTSSAKQSATSGQKHHLSGTQSSKSSAGLFKEKFSSLFSNSSISRSGSGYLSEPHADISVDEHGGVQVHKEVHVNHSPALSNVIESTRHDLRGSADTTDMIYAHYYEDIELGNYLSGRNSQVSSLYSSRIPNGTNIEALPARPKSPCSVKSFMSSHRQSRSPQVPAHPEWPNWLSSATIDEERPHEGFRSDAHPLRSSSQRKPEWQTWA